jgi:uncharacterized integral membrane protein
MNKLLKKWIRDACYGLVVLCMIFATGIIALAGFEYMYNEHWPIWLSIVGLLAIAVMGSIIIAVVISYEIHLSTPIRDSNGEYK